MGKILKQFRYYGKNNDNNFPSDLDSDKLMGSAFILQGNEFAPIVALGVQTIPGLKFYLNEAIDPIIVGNSGIYQLELINNYEINKLSFDKKSVENLIDDSSNSAYLIIDIIYETEE